MSMWAPDGSLPPTCRTSRASAQRGAARSSALTNCEDIDASRLTLPPSSQPRPCTVRGSRSWVAVTSAPRSRSARTTGASGRWWDRGSPSNRTSPAARVATGGRKRITVPAFPTSTDAGPTSGAGVTCHRPGASSITAPMARSPAAISEVSRLTSGSTSVLGERARAASTRARLVCDLDPGRRTVACTGAPAYGAGHGSTMAASVVRPAARGPRSAVSRAGAPGRRGRPAWPRAAPSARCAGCPSSRAARRAAPARPVPAGPRCRRRRASGRRAC